MTSERVVVVGGLSGIGKAIVDDLGADRCVVWSRRTGVDARDRESVQRATAELLREGTPWGWVHAVGDFDERSALDTDLAFCHAMLESNLTTALVVGQALLPAMRAARRGRVVLFGAAGLEARTAMRRAPAYFAAKAALLTWARALALDLTAEQVTVNMVSPGIIPHASSHAASQVRMAARVPAGRTGTPAEVARVVRFLLDPASGYVTGQNLDIDGGLALT
jgi:NAD(P)-dependent dehydrogenase (short-subunit alcohol dehydrogenase family)